MSRTYLENMTNLLTKAHQVKAIMKLYEYDHAFLNGEGAMHFTKPFGIIPRLHTEEADPRNPKGLTLHNGARRAEGVAAHHLALQIAQHLGVDVPDMFGIGSQLRVACTKIIEHLKK